MRERHTARLIVLDAAGRVLLFRVHLPSGRTFWITPGGRLEPGERAEDAAQRELVEETGLHILSIGPQLWLQEQVLDVGDGEEWLRERYFLVMAGASGQTLDHARRTEEEAAVLREDRWWSLDELRQTAETVFPLDLAPLLEPVLAGQIPATPVRI